MRYLVLVSLLLCSYSSHAQRPSLSDLISLTTCTDTTCIGAFAETIKYCKIFGSRVDGWGWISCDHVPLEWQDYEKITVLSFRSVNSKRSYAIMTYDSAYAAVLADEIGELGFQTEVMQYDEHTYLNDAHPLIRIERRERNMVNIASTDTMTIRGWGFNVIIEE